MPLQQVTYNDISQPLAIAPSAVENYMSAQGSSFGFRNRIINGAMVFDQRNAGGSVSNPNSYIIDRWLVETSNSSTTAQQVTDAPPGFTKSLKFVTTTGTSIVSGSYCDVTQKIEGYNVADFGFGTSSASTFTVSFWVKSSITGVFGITLRMENGPPYAGYFTTYTINNSNTWQYVTITVPGNSATAFGSTTNGIALSLNFMLGAGSTYTASTANTWGAYGVTGYGQLSSATGSNAVFTTTGATWQVTGVQLEKGPTASAFEYRDYTRELQMCQRYFESSADLGSSIPSGQCSSFANSGSNTTGYIQDQRYYQVQKRATPTITFWDNAGTSGVLTRNTPGSGSSNGQSGSTQQITTKVFQIYSSGSANFSGLLYYWQASAEL